jgi:predicted MFS family arabinose efflux permease
MTTLPITDSEASGSTTPGASAINGFLTVMNTVVVVVMLGQLADDVRAVEPGTAELITAFAETVSGQALDTIMRWPA